MKSEELEQRIHELILEIRTDDDDKIEAAKYNLIEMANDVGIIKLHGLLEAVKRDNLTVQWKIQDVLEDRSPQRRRWEEEDDTQRPQVVRVANDGTSATTD